MDKASLFHEGVVERYPKVKICIAHSASSSKVAWDVEDLNKFVDFLFRSEYLGVLWGFQSGEGAGK